MRADDRSVFGRVVLKDGSPCSLNDSLFNIDVSTRVSVFDTSGREIAPSVRANMFGDYVLGEIPASVPAGVVVRATCETATVDQRIADADVTKGRLDLTLPNARPQITASLANLGGQSVLSAPSGADIQAVIEATDPDSDVLHYKWVLVDGSGTLTTADAPSNSWKLPLVARQVCRFTQPSSTVGEATR